MRKHIYSLLFVTVISAGAWAQQPHPPGVPQNAPHPGPHPMPHGQPPRHAPEGHRSWIKPHDTNGNGILEGDEFASAIERTFAALDRDQSGVLEVEEFRPRPIPKIERPANGSVRPERDAPPNLALPPFFVKRSRDDREPLSKAEFESRAREVFTDMDENGDGVLTEEEAAKHMPPPPPAPPNPPNPPNAHFVGAELRFGDKVVKGQPFSAEIVIEESRRLFDGSLVNNQTRGAVYRDAAGRTRREQPLQVVAGFPVIGTGQQPQMLVFINDFGTRSHIFLDMNNKVARKSPIGNAPPPKAPGNPPGARTESLGTRTIEGVTAEGTRMTFEMAAGHMGSDKTLAVVSETWFSPELQVVVLSRHVDPIGGEHVFRLVNIKRTEPLAELFSIPAGFRFNN